MSATLTVEEIEKLEAFVMPKPARGQQVLWYPRGIKSETPEVAFCREVGKRGIVLAIGGVSYESVRHIDDPKLALNEHQREGGAWDFPGDPTAELQSKFAKLEERFAALEARILTLEVFVEEPSPKKGK